MRAPKSRHVLVGKGQIGLCIGETTDTDAQIVKTESIRLNNCRHISYWYGKSGGITSLAAFGPCGPRVKECRIGAQCSSSLLTEVKAVHDLSPEAIAAFAAVVPQ